MNSDISVVEVITNGPDGYPSDGIVQIAVTEIGRGGDVVSSLFETVKSDTDRWTQLEREYVRSKVSPEDIANGVDAVTASADLKKVLAGKDVTSFDVSNTFNGYLIYEPWDLTHEVSVLPSVGSRLPGNLRSGRPYSENSRINKAYSSMYPDDEPAVGDGNTALDYALRTSYIILKMKDAGLY